MTASITETAESALEIAIEADEPHPRRSDAVDALETVDCSCRYDATTGAHRVSLRADRSDVRPSTAVVEIVAALAGKRPEQLEPLYGSVDPDALDALVRRADGDAAYGGPVISFTFGGHEITVYGA